MSNARVFAVAGCVAAVVGVGGGSALAGEVTGPPGGIGHPGTPKDMSHANSMCAFSGLNDFVSPTGRTCGCTVPTRARSTPGDACRGGSNPYTP